MVTFKRLALSWLLGFVLGTVFLGALGSIHGYLYGRETGDAQNVWFRPGWETAFLHGVVLPILLCGWSFALACGVALTMNWRNGLTRSGIVTLLISLMFFLVIGLLQAWSFRNQLLLFFS